MDRWRDGWTGERRFPESADGDDRRRVRHRLARAGEVLPGIGCELREAAFRAEKVRRALVVEPAGRFRGVDGHPADGIDSHAPILATPCGPRVVPGSRRMRNRYN